MRHSAPVLAVEVAGQDQDEASLREKAAWYLNHGVGVVWLILPQSREVVVLKDSTESRHAGLELLPTDPRLPGLAPPVARFFAQLDRV